MSGGELDPFHLTLERVRRSFDRASSTYQAAAVLQSSVADELLSRLDVFGLQPHRVLDLGSGPGRTAAALKKKYPRAQVIALDVAPRMLQEARRQQRFFQRFARVCGDAGRMPLADASADVIFSSLMLQWCDLEAVFAETRRVLRPNGLFLFSTLGPDTLKELRAAWAEADDLNHVNQFIDMHDVGDAVVRAGLTEPVLDVERLQLTYPDVMALMRDLKCIGAHNVTAGRARGLTGKTVLRTMEAAYEKFRRSGLLPATYEIVYGVTWGSRERPGSRAVDGEVRIATSTIRRRASGQVGP